MLANPTFPSERIVHEDEDLARDAKYNCRFHFIDHATATGNLALCEELNAEGYRAVCIEDVVEGLVKDMDDLDQCDTLADPLAREHCIELLSIRLADLSRYHELTDTKSKNACIAGVVLRRDDITDVSICDEVVPTYFYEMLNSETGKYETEYDHLARDICILAIVRNTEDPSLCSRLSEARFRGMCAAALATRYDDVSLCGDVDDPPMQCVCVAIMALTTEDPALCRMITNEKAARICAEAQATKEQITDLVTACMKCKETCVAGLDDTVTDEAAQEDRSSICPTAIPKEATHQEGEKYEYWAMPDGAKVGPDRTWYDAGRTNPRSVCCYNSDGEKHGPCVHWYENGQTSEEYTYKDGKRNGVFRRWFENENPRDEGKYKEDELDGIYRSYWENGNQLLEETYSNGEWGGSRIEYGKSGSECTITKGTVTDEKFTGTVTKKCKSPGRIWVEVYENGKYIDGDWK